MPDVPTARLDLSVGATGRDEDSNGLVLSQVYLVNTADEARALTASGLPRQGDAFAIDQPGLVCVSRQAAFESGVDDPVTLTGGWTRVTCRFATSGRWGRGNVPSPTAATLKPYTEFQPSTTSVTVYQSWPPDAPGVVGPPKPPINNGRGVNIETGQLFLAVHEFKSGSYDIRDWLDTYYLTLRGTVNANTIVIAPLLGLGANIQFNPGELRYRTASLSVSGNVIEIVHQLEAAPDFLARWATEYPDGTVGPIDSAKVYPEVAWPNLGVL